MECLSFTAYQKVVVGLLQPAPAIFYDYYEPGTVFFSNFQKVSLNVIHFKSIRILIFADERCTVFYSHQKRSKLVSTLCSEEVCQCAESRYSRPKPVYIQYLKVYMHLTITNTSTNVFYFHLYMNDKHKVSQICEIEGKFYTLRACQFVHVKTNAKNTVSLFCLSVLLTNKRYNSHTI